MRIILGVGGGIAAYKSASLLRLFKEAGHQVTVVPTEAAEKFVGRATWEALSGQPVSTTVFDAVDTVNHVRLGQDADLVVVAPATADVLARAAAGLADDLLTNTLLMARGPVVFVPAMHTEMWQHPATQTNIATLRGRGTLVMDPAVGRLTGKDTGPGRLPEPEEIFDFALAQLDESRPAAGTTMLLGKRVVITSGGTREPLDPVRFLGNRSSGKQGVALARAAAAAGAEVELVAAHMDVAPPEGVKTTRVETALQLRTATLEASARADVVIMAAAVADFRPAEAAETKIKKRDDAADPVITLVRNPDILQEIVQVRRDSGTGPALIVGFAAETGDSSSDVLGYARQKLARKGCDLLVLNQVGRDLVFGQDQTAISILDNSGADPQVATGSKDTVARTIIERVAAELVS
ncbi:bifunctional phosphopantothenoylcysteine decarboxylase/phosphopantothenate--cysteine ligase CoaBC [Arthrobacter crystallopoietes]|uniref:Coenzyme A biosynthesis bifunctional protein CoaBC n=1 Tax=Crystallibacter crystallopoietes TaxID=37928 RepID=A0A1H1GGA7_9MICC|nr:bifunctional phosphopantothenoylcysteine decarboxylase/phosphopantothenate--cysteine ligase CoaBC [Arthrobacter crystallopoietes]AUI52590.1 phosphopantothenoylcysteine decarboxylase [Arthrobacter crystallopoietes]SDR12129.1 phosphopantothenoylcysteine decarboxylase / phosphopantothenate--cysteine ligase [Arthrobacter crystallopoietes]